MNAATNSFFSRPGQLLGSIALVCIAAVGAALVSQHIFKMQPCPWCILQRVIFLAIALSCLLGLLWRSFAGRILSGMAGLLLALCGGAAALWQHFVAAATESCNLTLADRMVTNLHLDSMLPDVFEARASCSEAAVRLLGIPYDFWSLGLFVLIAVGAVQVMRFARRG
jgi:protein dithiol:quinone oxidoreductase